eukprot:jgi/Psemu1/307066/fgenesh1_kg.301_\
MEDTETPPNLFVREVASLSDLSAKDVEELTEGCTAIVSCLGHNLSLRGIYRDGPFVTETTKRLVTAMPASSCRFLLMGSDGVAHPDGVTDPKRSLLERAVIWMIRYLIPPHADNEGAARYLYNDSTTAAATATATATAKKWCVVRPGDLTDDDTDPKGYELLDHPRGSLFGGDSTSRMQVAACMVELATMDSSAFDKSYNHKMPVVYTSGCVVNNNNNNNNNEKEEEETKKAK